MTKQKSDGSSTFDRFNKISQKVDPTSLSPGEIAALNAAGIDPSKLLPSSKGGRPHRFDAETELLICSLIEKGFSITSIADQFKTRPQTIRNIIERNVGSKKE